MNTSSTDRGQITTDTCAVCGNEVDVWLCSVLTFPKAEGSARYTYRQETAHRELAPSGQRLPCPGRPA